MSRPKSAQAKHIDDREVLAAIRDIGITRRRNVPCKWAFTWDIELAFPGVHPKVLAAKLKALVRRKLTDGCPCGCRGDFELTEAGWDMAIAVPQTPRQLKYD